jgi:hypothetical protein
MSIPGGTTIHSGLDFKFGNAYSDLTNETLDKYRRSLGGLVGIILDEMSMVSADGFYNIHRRLQQIMLSDDLFGGCFVLLVGDLCQLPPVQAKPIYERPRTRQNSTLFNSCDNLWNSFVVVSLKTNFRQGNSSTWTQTLNRIRLGQEAITEEDVGVLESRRITNFPEVNLDDACHVFYTNIDVTNHNVRMLNSLPTPLVTIDASIFHPKQYKPSIKDKIGTIDDTALLKSLELKKGARVKLVFNVSVSDSLTNGALGQVIDIVFQENSSEVKCIIVSFDNPNVGESQREQYAHIASNYSDQLGTPIFRLQLEYQPSSKSKRLHAVKCKVIQFPLRLAWAMTAHTTQGSTFKKGQKLVCHGSKRLPQNMAYVMLSRVSDVNDLYLDSNFDMKSIKASNGSLNQNMELEERSIANDEQLHYDIAYLNVHSLQKHWEDILSDKKITNASQSALVEVWVPKRDHANYKLPKKGLYYSLLGKGKGVCLFSSTLDKNSKQLEHEHFQCVTITMKPNLQLIVVYMSSKITRSEQEKFVQDITIIQDFTKERIIVGDFNFNSTDWNLITELLKGLGFTQLVKRPTHLAGRTIDHLYVTNEKLVKDLDFYSPYYTDHTGIFIRLHENKESS